MKNRTTIFGQENDRFGQENDKYTFFSHDGDISDKGSPELGLGFTGTPDPRGRPRRWRTGGGCRLQQSGEMVVAPPAAGWRRAVGGGGDENDEQLGGGERWWWI